jgi:hypothetical protein
MVALGVMWCMSCVMWWVGGVMWCHGVGCDGWPMGFIEIWCSEGSLIGLYHTRVIGLA